MALLNLAYSCAEELQRLQCGNTGTANLTNGFFADIDSVNGTIGTCTAVGNGTGTSSSIVAYNGGFICTIIGKASSGAQTPVVAVVSCSAAGVTSYTGDTTQCFIFADFGVWTASSLTTSLGVDTDTGWLSGDVIAIASTSRTPADCSLTALSSGATSTTLPVILQPWTAYSGTSPAQAEIILITRNVKISSTSQALTSYVFVTATATVNVAWAEFWNMSTNATNKNGLWINGVASGTAVAKSFTFCSFHDGHQNLVTLNTTGLANSINNPTTTLTSGVLVGDVTLAVKAPTSPDVWPTSGPFRVLVDLRFLTSIFIGGVLPTAVALNNEFAPRHLRATMVVIMRNSMVKKWYRRTKNLLRSLLTT